MSSVRTWRVKRAPFVQPNGKDLPIGSVFHAEIESVLSQHWKLEELPEELSRTPPEVMPRRRRGRPPKKRVDVPVPPFDRSM